MKRTFYTELAYLLGITVLATGAAFMAQADFGLSMVVAPAYLVHLKVSTYLPFFSFGMAEYVVQALLLTALFLLLGKFKKHFLFSFVTAVFYGLVLDCMVMLIALIPLSGFAYQLFCYLIGMFFCAVGISLSFHTYISPLVYELFVQQVSEKIGMHLPKFKTIYDCTSCAVAIVLSFALFGLFQFEGVKWGTVVCALINGTLVGRISHFFDTRFEFRDKLALRKYFGQ